MKTILFPSDFSKNALNAVKYAMAVYQDEPCKYILLNAYAVNEYVKGTSFIAQPSDNLMQEAKNLSESNLEKLQENLEELRPNKEHTFTAISENLSLVDAIHEQLRAKKIDLIVIGTQGSTGDYKTIYGSNTIEMMENVKNCPILAIPGEEKFTGLNEIVLANGFHLPFDESDFDYLIHLAREKKAPIRVLTISEVGGLTKEQEENKKRIASYLEDVPHSFHILEHVNVPLGIYCFSESRKSGMICFVNKKYNFIEKLLFKPLYKNLGDYSKIPVLVLHRTGDS